MPNWSLLMFISHHLAVKARLHDLNLQYSTVQMLPYQTDVGRHLDEPVDGHGHGGVHGAGHQGVGGGQQVRRHVRQAVVEVTERFREAKEIFIREYSLQNCKCLSAL